MKSKPKIAVLMATYNGVCCLSEQVTSILNQVGVRVTLFVSDDSSSDGTREWIENLTNSDNRVTLLPQVAPMRAAGKNFYRLICDIDVSGYDYIAFSDQDDIWNLDKLHNHIQFLRKNQADGISSNAIAFWPDGKTSLIEKSQPEKRWDFLFQSPGAGCTFLITPWLFARVREQLQLGTSKAKDIVMHDWLIYAICRASGRRWAVDSVPSIQYRQHQNNVIGANVGLRAVLRRLIEINNGWYRGEVKKISNMCASISQDQDVKDIANLLEDTRFVSKVKLLMYIGQARKRLLHRAVLGFLILFCIF
jgi:rhamnosyltransferase